MKKAGKAPRTKRAQPKVHKANARPAADSGDDERDGRRLRRRRTEARLVEALAGLLRESGVAALGINALAERAGVEKVLIYRYFGGLEGLMTEYAKGSEFWPTVEEIIGPDAALLSAPDHALVAAKLLGNYARALQRRPVTLDLLAWECAHRNPLTVALETVREARARELFQRLLAAGFPLTGDAAAISALLSAAINYLVVRSRDIKLFAGLELDGEATWTRLEAVMAQAFRGVLGSAPLA